VRGKVRSLRLAQRDYPHEEEARLVADARAYFDLAWAHAGGFTRPTLVVAMGLPATGKTTLAESLARHLGMVHLSSDLVRKGIAGVRPTERPSDSFREGLYDPTMTQRTYAALRRHAARWLRRGRAAVLDATYGSPDERAQVQRLAQRLGADLRVILCKADDATLRTRLARRASEKGVVSDARLELWPELRAAFHEPDELSGVLEVDATRSVQQMEEQALALLRATLWSKSGVTTDPGRHTEGS
jgi:predicted kinase